MERRDSYLYRHIRLDKNVPFYIGVGTNTSKNHGYARAHTKHHRNKHWCSIVKNTNYEVEIMLDNLTISEAKDKEIEFISFYGRADTGKGTLVNFTSGGDGLKEASKETIERIKKSLLGNQFAKGLKHTPETKKRISDKIKGRIVSEYSRKRTSEVWTGRKHSPEAIAKISEKAKGNKRWLGKKHSEETKLKISESKTGCAGHWKGKKLPSHMIIKLSTRMKGNKIWLGRHHTDESKAKISATRKANAQRRVVTNSVG